MSVNMSQLRLSSANLTNGAEPVQQSRTQAQSPSTAVIDWRVSLAVPDVIRSGPVLEPLLGATGTNNKMIFPFNPTIVYSHTANYTTISPTHTNYPFYAFQNSQVDQIQLAGEFVSENEADARYWIACVHFLRTMTKMFYGNGEYLGSPPPLSRLNGYGKHVLNDIPVIITNFTVDLPSDVDYIPCAVNGTVDTPVGPQSVSEINYVPVQSNITVTVVPNYARASHSQFNLKSFAAGNFIGDEKGFV